MDLMKKLRETGTFQQLESLSIVERVKSLIQAAEGIYQQIDRTMEEGKDVLTAADMEELRPHMDRIVPRAIQAGKDLDASLEEAKAR